MATLTVGDLQVEPGRRVMQVLEAPVGERTVKVPVIVINGEQEGPRVTITGGVHGSEYVGIEAARRLGTTTDPHDVSGSLVIVPIVNTTAFHTRTTYISGLDTNNLNRMFPGKPDGAPAEILADWIFRTIIQPSQYYIDLHGGDMIEALVPFVAYVSAGGPEVEETARKMALANGIARVMRSDTRGSTYSAAAAAGIPAILAEIGGQGVWNEDEVEEHMEGVRRVLRYLHVLPGEQPIDESRPLLETFAWMRSEHDGLFHSTVRVGDMVEKGQNVGRVTDYFGNELQRVDAIASGEVVFLVTSLAMNAGDPLLAIVA